MKIIFIIYFLLDFPFSIYAQISKNLPADSAQLYKNTAGTVILWQRELESKVSAPLAVSGKNVLLSTADGKIFCFDLNGNLIWNYETGGTITNQLSIESGILSAVIVEGDLFSFDAVTGELLQVIGLSELITTQPIIIDILNNRQKSKGIVLGTIKGNVYCYDLFTFELIWKNNSAGDIIGNRIVYTKDRIIFGSRDKQLFCIDAETGVINWKWKYSKAKNSQVQDVNSKTFFPAAGGNFVYIFDPEEKITSAVDLLLGTTIWQKKNFKGWNSIVVGSDNEKLFMPGSASNLYIISAEDGKLTKEIKIDFDTGEKYCEPAEWDNNILLGSSSGRIYLIDSEYNWNHVLSLGGASINSIANVTDSIFAASTLEGRIVVFQIY